MPVTVVEKVDSRKWLTGENASVERLYIVAATSDDYVAKQAVEIAAPTSYYGLVRQSITLEPEWVDAAKNDGQWHAVVHYGRREPPQLGESTFRFEISGAEVRVTQSIATVRKHGLPGKPAPDCKGAIGFTGDRVEGVDIVVPVFAFSETHYLPANKVTPAYRGTLFRLTGKVNDAAFKGCAAGECLFMGASGSKRGAEDWEITYQFAASPNRVNIPVGQVEPISKRGWEHLWIRYGDSVDAGAIVKVPVAAYVEQVYETADFSLLDIGI